MIFPILGLPSHMLLELMKKIGEEDDENLLKSYTTFTQDVLPMLEKARFSCENFIFVGDLGVPVLKEFIRNILFKSLYVDQSAPLVELEELKGLENREIDEFHGHLDAPLGARLSPIFRNVNFVNTKILSKDPGILDDFLDEVRLSRSARRNLKNLRIFDESRHFSNSFLARSGECIWRGRFQHPNVVGADDEIVFYKMGIDGGTAIIYNFFLSTCPLRFLTLLREFHECSNSWKCTRKCVPFYVILPKRCAAPHMGGFFADKRLYGGQAVAQAFRALQDHKGTELVPTTMHYRFCAPGHVNIPIDYSLEEYESVTRVNAIQEGKIIGTAHFRMAGDQFPSYDLNLDYIPEPEEAMPLGDIVKEIVSSMANQGDLSFIDELIYDIRLVEWARNPQTDVPRNVYWARLHCLERVPLNCGLQSALLLSDFFSIQIVEDVYSSQGSRLGTAASLSHSVHFHQRNEEINPHDWFLYRVECETIGQSRAILKAYVYDSQRRAVLTVIQEAYADRIPIKKAAKM